MHPSIKKFLERNGVPIYSYQSNNGQFWFLCSNPDYYNQDGPPPPLLKDIVCITCFNKNEERDTYFFENKIFTEKMMLRIIELQSFI